MMKIWMCKIGECDESDVPSGGDFPMRRIVEAGYLAVTGKHCDFLFSGWAGELTKEERAVHENREPADD